MNLVIEDLQIKFNIFFPRRFDIWKINYRISADPVAYSWVKPEDSFYNTVSPFSIVSAKIIGNFEIGKLVSYINSEAKYSYDKCEKFDMKSGFETWAKNRVWHLFPKSMEARFGGGYLRLYFDLKNIYLEEKIIDEYDYIFLMGR